LNGIVELFAAEAIATLLLSLWHFGVIRKSSLRCFAILKNELLLIGDISFGVGISAFASVFNDAIKAVALSTDIIVMLISSVTFIIVGAILRRKGRK
jgi:hypothetical protein